jgi:hypothetical protein
MRDGIPSNVRIAALEREALMLGNELPAGFDVASPGLMGCPQATMQREWKAQAKMTEMGNK